MADKDKILEKLQKLQDELNDIRESVSDMNLSQINLVLRGQLERLLVVWAIHLHCLPYTEAAVHGSIGTLGRRAIDDASGCAALARKSPLESVLAEALQDAHVKACEVREYFNSAQDNVSLYHMLGHNLLQRGILRGIIFRDFFKM